MSLVARIHCGTWDLVCSMTDIMPRISVNNVAVLGPGAEVGRHGVDEVVGVVQHQRKQPVDPVAPDRDTRRPLSRRTTPLPVQNRTHVGADGGCRSLHPLVGCAHRSPYPAIVR